ncbi:glutamate-1-semialdehyde 2,1-aminomutase [Candidatus Symbiobacter mobilis]|uniref:Glutamate-1-semialdehyde 2,1-aminomutase n=1 Tax=Candidatus Symbiobacter mobilis CR TaxID=946483 RepID=U5N747_9BURK|nr:glutamate-1-semialdehyde 2,1-aminomutase [Candidatus Symbiobacter mobilis]AGX87217.1 glutamate-1-semialdehyde 2,1-aminomutase [Candidatus Symbiobacter mobilis CR]
MDRNVFLYERASACIPGGVNSPVRAFRAVGGTPRFIARAQGSALWDANGQRYIDYIGAWGPMILGHSHPAVVEAVERALRDGFAFGAPTERETELAEFLVAAVPSMEMVRLVNSGTEAAMSAIRLARGFTQRNLLVKFEGCYHGHCDPLLVHAGSGLSTLGHPSSAGVPAEVAGQTIVLRYNDVAGLERAFAEHGPAIAALIVEPICGNMNFVRASVSFLRQCRALCTRHGAVFILDEVMTGFRVAWGGAQSLYAREIPGFAPDLTLLGKVIGGGMPLAAFGGRREIMRCLSPLGSVYQAGTLSGNPVATACGLATLREVAHEGFHDQLSQTTRTLLAGLRAAAERHGVPFCADSEGGMMGWFLLPTLPHDYPAVMQSSGDLFARFFHGLLDRGIYTAPALFEAGFVSAAHSAQDVADTIRAADEVFALLR